MYLPTTPLSQAKVRGVMVFAAAASTLIRKEGQRIFDQLLQLYYVNLGAGTAARTAAAKPTPGSLLSTALTRPHRVEKAPEAPVRGALCIMFPLCSPVDVGCACVYFLEL